MFWSGAERARDRCAVARRSASVASPGQRRAGFSSAGLADLEWPDPAATIPDMEISRTIIVLDAADLDKASSFWARLLGGTVDPEDDWHTVRVDGEAPAGADRAPVRAAGFRCPHERPESRPRPRHGELGAGTRPDSPTIPPAQAPRTRAHVGLGVQATVVLPGQLTGGTLSTSSDRQEFPVLRQRRTLCGERAGSGTMAGCR
jgi:hypothetical protein